LPNGRQDESIGAVNIAGLKGENRANAMMKAETKAKRRVTLSICGLGLLDETEVETVGASPASLTTPAVAVERVLVAGNEHEKHGDPQYADVVVNTETGEELPDPPAGYHYVSGYDVRNGWHEFKLLKYDAQGGSIKVSTKRDFGFIAGEAEKERIPVKVTTQTKKNAPPGEFYLGSIEKLKLEDLPTLKPFAKEPPKADAEIVPTCEVCGKPYAECKCDDLAF
jgi:hypothetical protein